jgi:beta-galactosidase GanA
MQLCSVGIWGSICISLCHHLGIGYNSSLQLLCSGKSTEYWKKRWKVGLKVWTLKESLRAWSRVAYFISICILIRECSNHLFALASEKWPLIHSCLAKTSLEEEENRYLRTAVSLTLHSSCLFYTYERLSNITIF